MVMWPGPAIVYLRNLSLIGALLVAITLSASGAATQPLEEAWLRAGEDLDVTSVQLSGGAIFTSELFAVRSSLERYRIGVVRAKDFNLQTTSVRTLCRRSRATVCINANFFDEHNDPLGLIVSRGILQQGMHNGGRTLTGVFQVGRTGARILARSDFSPLGVVDAIQAGPRLISGGKPIEGLRETTSKRAGVCIDRAGRVIIFGVFSAIVGTSISELQSRLPEAPLGCVDALNLDGGGSAQLFVNDEIPGAPEGWQEIYFPGRDEVPVALALFVKQ